MDREDKILEYIQLHPGCTKTKVKNCTDMAEGTADKILKKLIDKEKKVICIIDKVNPRIHHLYINDGKISRMKIQNLLLSKVKEHVEKQMYTTTQLTTGEWISVPVNREFTIRNPRVMEIIDSLTTLRMAK